MDNARPSIDPANLNSLTGTFKEIIKKIMQGIDGCLPVRVINYDKAANRVQVQPLIQLLDTSDQTYSRAQIASVPCVRYGGGGFVLRFNYKPGDLGIIIASDRDISIFLQSYKESKPQTNRIKNFADSWFFGDEMKDVVIAEEDEENAVLQSLDGAVKISLGTSKIKIAAPTVQIVTETAEITAATATITSPETEIISSTNVIMTTPLLAVSGNITAGGTITPLTPPP